jgi:hypothetical protein
MACAGNNVGSSILEIYKLNLICLTTLAFTRRGRSILAEHGEAKKSAGERARTLVKTRCKTRGNPRSRATPG